MYQLSWFYCLLRRSVNQQIGLGPTSLTSPLITPLLQPFPTPPTTTFIFVSPGTSRLIRLSLPYARLSGWNPFRPSQGRSRALALEWWQMMEALSAAVAARGLFFPSKKTKWLLQPAATNAERLTSSVCTCFLPATFPSGRSDWCHSDSTYYIYIYVLYIIYFDLLRKESNVSFFSGFVHKRRFYFTCWPRKKRQQQRRDGTCQSAALKLEHSHFLQPIGTSYRCEGAFPDVLPTKRPAAPVVVRSHSARGQPESHDSLVHARVTWLTDSHSIHVTH